MSNYGSITFVAN